MHNPMMSWLDIACISSSQGLDVSLELLDESLGLVALQGPTSAKALSGLIDGNNNLDNLAFMSSFEGAVAGVPGCRITRCGWVEDINFLS